jgi:hypothetical protein
VTSNKKKLFCLDTDVTVTTTVQNIIVVVEMIIVLNEPGIGRPVD